MLTGFCLRMEGLPWVLFIEVCSPRMASLPRLKDWIVAGMSLGNLNSVFMFLVIWVFEFSSVVDSQFVSGDDKCGIFNFVLFIEFIVLLLLG